MSSLKPISTIGPRSRGRGWGKLFAGLVLGLAAGIPAGYYLLPARPPAGGQAGRPPARSAPAAPPEQQPAVATPAIVSSTPDTAAPTSDAGATATARPPALDSWQRLEIVLQKSIYTMLARRLPGRQADVLNAHLGRILVWWLDLRRDVAPGDLLQVLYHPSEDINEFRVLALRYRSSQRGFDRRAFFFKPAGARYGRYYDEQGREVEARLQHSPLKEYEQITERMNLAGRRHHGVDFKADEGTPVVAPYRARVMRVNFHTRLNGNCLDLRYLNSGRHALFLHLSQIAPAIRPGVVVAAGQRIALSGNTGRSFAPHLHYELHAPGGRLLDPFLAEPTTHRALTGTAREAFQARARELSRRLEGK